MHQTGSDPLETRSYLGCACHWCIRPRNEYRPKDVRDDDVRDSRVRPWDEHVPGMYHLLGAYVSSVLRHVHSGDYVTRPEDVHDEDVFVCFLGTHTSSGRTIPSSGPVRPDRPRACTSQRPCNTSRGRARRGRTQLCPPGRTCVRPSDAHALGRMYMTCATRTYATMSSGHSRVGPWDAHVLGTHCPRGTYVPATM